MCNAYGITETGSWVAGLAQADVPAEDGLIGTGWGAVIKVLRTDQTAELPAADLECQPGESGYVWLNTPALMKGYFRRDDLTARAVVCGWFLTGDIGCLDDQGRLLLRGRERDEINKGGMKIYPSDIDAVVELHAAAADVCAFALDDAIYGQGVGMAVVLSDGSDAAIGSLHEWMKSRLAEHKTAGTLVAARGHPRAPPAARSTTTRSRPACEKRPALDLPALLARIQPMSGSREQQRQELLGFLRSIQKAGLPVERLAGRRSLVASGLIDSLAILQIVTAGNHLRHRFRGPRGIAPRTSRPSAASPKSSASPPDGALHERRPVTRQPHAPGRA